MGRAVCTAGERGAVGMQLCPPSAKGRQRHASGMQVGAGGTERRAVGIYRRRAGESACSRHLQCRKTLSELARTFSAVPGVPHLQDRCDDVILFR